MIEGPKLPHGHPDYTLACEQAAEDGFNALAEALQAAGWAADEVASALLSLALHQLEKRKADAVDELHILMSKIPSAL